MALFQPTNITPDIKGGVKNGVILIAWGTTNPSTVDISWSVNGNSTMTAYQIDFYQNTAASTQTGTTGKITLSPAFSAVSSDGTVSRFTATVAWSLISGTYSGTGTLQGKFKIKMWWGSGANDYVEQKSLSVFEVSKEGKVAVSTPTGYGGNVTFNAVYAPPLASTYGDVPLNWTRWQLYSGSTSNDPLYDTGKVTGATTYTWSPPTLFGPDDYIAVFSAEGANGAEYREMKWVSIPLNPVAAIDGLLTVQCDKASGAVKVLFDKSEVTVSGETSGTVRVGDSGEIILSSYTSNITYRFAGYSDTEWSFIWHGKINDSYGFSTLFNIYMSNNQRVFARNAGSGKLELSAGPSTRQINYTVNREYWIIFTTGYFTDGTDTGFQWLVYSPQESGYGNYSVPTFAQSKPVAVSIYGPSTTYSFQIGFGAGNSSLAVGMSDNTAVTTFSGPCVEFPYITGSTDAVWRPLGGGTIPGSLFRMDGPYDLGETTYVGDFLLPDPALTPYILDYAATNGNSYSYIVTGADENMENCALSRSSVITPCFWEWTLIEARQSTLLPDVFKAVNVFNFRCNVNTGAYNNRATRNIQPTFTPYPAVFRSKQNSRQGTLSGLIGSTSMGVYTDSNTTEQSLRALSSSKNQLFLRDRRGNFMKIALAGEISMTVNDNSLPQEITVSVPWVEQGSAKGLSVYDVGFIEPEPEPEP